MRLYPAHLLHIKLMADRKDTLGANLEIQLELWKLQQSHMLKIKLPLALLLKIKPIP